MNINLNEVREHVELYFKENLPKYTVLEIRRKSSHPDDSYLFMVSAKNDNGTYAVWTGWNELNQSLNHGHYDLKSVKECENIFEEFFLNSEYQPSGVEIEAYPSANATDPDYYWELWLAVKKK